MSLISYKTAEMCCFHALKKRWCIWTKSSVIVHLHHDHGAYGRNLLEIFGISPFKKIKIFFKRLRPYAP